MDLENVIAELLKGKSAEEVAKEFSDALTKVEKAKQEKEEAEKKRLAALEAEWANWTQSIVKGVDEHVHNPFTNEFTYADAAGIAALILRREHPELSLEELKGAQKGLEKNIRMWNEIYSGIRVGNKRKEKSVEKELRDDFKILSDWIRDMRF